MAQIKRERLPNRFCPECYAPMLYWGSIKKENMCICIIKDCNNLIPFEQALKLEDLKEVRKLVKTSYLEGVEFGSLQCGVDEEFLEDIEIGEVE